MMPWMLVYVCLLTINAWAYPRLGAHASEFINLGGFYYFSVLLFAIVTECALRGFVFKRLLDDKQMSFWAATAITSVLYLMFVYGNGKPYTFIDRSSDLLLYDSLSKVVFSVVACGVYAQRRSLLWVTCFSVVFYMSTLFFCDGFPM